MATIETVSGDRAETHDRISAREDVRPISSTSRDSICLNSIGRMISGLGEIKTAQYRTPVIEPEKMAKLCRVTFRPLPERFKNSQILQLRERLQRELHEFGVEVLPWEQATVDFYQTGVVPILRRPWRYKTRGVLGNVNAVFDVDRPRTALTWGGIILTETLYVLEGLFRTRAQDSLPALARLSLWSEDLAVRNLLDHRRTQVLSLTQVDDRLVRSGEPYANRVRLGLAALAQNLAHMVLGVSGSQISMINLNMSDSIYKQSELRRFTRHVLVPKLFVPIVPLLQSYFAVEHHEPNDFPEVTEVAEMGRKLGATGLLPAGHDGRRILWRKSRSDIVRMYADGRTGVSFGFIAKVEKPRYVGPRDISGEEWKQLSTSEVYSPDDVRRNESGRYYVKIERPNEPTTYRQIPDLWIASSRSGSDKSALSPARDVIRIAYDGQFRMSLPHNTQVGDVKPSFDIRVMVALALSAALYNPEFIEAGAALFHFHGYPHRKWFRHDECYAGAEHPTVPCGTFEAGVLNFQAMARMAENLRSDTALACTIEPDHGTNVIARDWRHLVRRVCAGVEQGQIELGSRHFPSLIDD